MFIKVHLDFVHEFQVQLKGVVPKNKGHTNFYERYNLTEKVYLMYNVSSYIDTEQKQDV